MAPGLLFVGLGGKVTAYESAFKPAARGIAIGTDVVELTAGRRVQLVGVLGTGIRAGKPATTIQAAPAHRGRFRAVGKADPARDGGFVSRHKVVRNTRFRATAAGVTSGTTTVYAWPTVALGNAKAAGSRIRVPVTAKTPATRLGGRTLVLYLDRKGDNKALTRLGSARLRGGKRARGSLVFKPLRRVGRKDSLAVCIRGGLSIDLGRPSPLTRRCGVRRLAQG